MLDPMDTPCTPDPRADAPAAAQPGNPSPTRRQFLRALAIASAGTALPSLGWADTANHGAGRMPDGAPIDTPEAALATLLQGNRRFASGRMISCQAPIGPRLRETVEKQEPFAAVLSCADSRVPVEMVFDQELGRLFVARVAGNIATAEIIASLEYGVAVLGTKLILVMGHGHCGAVKAAIAAKPAPGQISSLYEFIQPAVQQAGHHLDAAIHDNARIQASLLATSSPVLSKAISEGTLRIVPAYYDLASGEVNVLKD